jgi:hypothetical protein
MNLKELRTKEETELSQPDRPTNEALESIKRLNREALLMESLAISNENYLKLQTDLTEKLSTMTDNHALIKAEVQNYTQALKELITQENRNTERLRERLKYEIEESNKKWTAQTQASSESLKELSTVAGNNIATALKTLRSDVKEELQNLSNKGAMAVREVADEASAMVAASRFIVIGLLVLQIALDAYLIYKLW